MKTVIATVSTALVLLSDTSHTGTLPDFSGLWEMDPSRSEATAQVIPTKAMIVAIVQSPTEIRIGTTANDIIETVVYQSLDGLPAGSREPAAWFRWDGTTLVTTHQDEVNKMAVTISQLHTLNADATEMTVKRTLTVHHGYEGARSGNRLPSTGTETDVFVRKR